MAATTGATAALHMCEKVAAAALAAYRGLGSGSSRVVRAAAAIRGVMAARPSMTSAPGMPRSQLLLGRDATTLYDCSSAYI